MKKILLTAIIALFLCNMEGNAQVMNQQNYIETSTRVEKKITPDEIYLTIVIDEQSGKSKTTLQAKESEMKAELRKLGIDVANSLTVKDISSNLQSFFLRKDEVLSKKTYNLKLKDAATMSAVVSALANINITQVSLYRTAVSPELEKATKDALLTEAVQKAKENAEIMAKAAGCSIGKPIYMQNHYSFTQDDVVYGAAPKMMMAMSSRANDAVEAEEGVEMSKTSLYINVTCHFAIE
ncbi:MAG: SIMPL domain-containing protein [Bacteroidales bacterium]|nr:SIMPL domain-containing protein [Bacteroidales bacterium]